MEGSPSNQLGGPFAAPPPSAPGEHRYRVAPEREQRFLEAMAEVRLLRLRTGGTQWGLFRDGETEHQFVELFVVASWDEQLRQRGERQTGAGRQIHERATELSDPPPETSHLIAAEVGG